MKPLISFLFFLTSLCTFSQNVTIDYEAWNPSNPVCSLFVTATNVPATGTTSGTIEHQRKLGQIEYNTTDKSIRMQTIFETTGLVTKGGRYRIAYSFKSGYSYSVYVTAAAVENTVGFLTGPYIRLDINNNGGGGSTGCNGPEILSASTGGSPSALQLSADIFAEYQFNFGQSNNSTTLEMTAFPANNGGTKTVRIRKIRIVEIPPPPTFTITPNPIPVTCGTTTPLELTINNVYSSPGVTGYTWNLGTNNTWQYNGSQAPSSIPTSTNKLTLSPTCGVAPTSITATAAIGLSSYQTNTANVSLTIPTMSINGSGEFCSGTSNYTIDNLPCNASVTWSVFPSNSNAVSLSCTSCTSTTLTKTGNGIVTLIATITACGGSPIVKTKAIAVGAPVPIFPPMPEICEGAFELCVPPIANTISHEWKARVPGGLNVTLQETSDWCVEAPAQALWVDLTIVNSCGSSTTRFRVTYSNCGNFLMASPNPGSNQINLTALKGASFEQVRIYDKSGNLRKQFKFIKGTKSAILNISELPADLYKVQAFDGRKWVSISIVKQ